jgi:hypothetical protein
MGMMISMTTRKKIRHEVIKRKDGTIHEFSTVNVRNTPLYLRIYDTLFAPSIGHVYFHEDHVVPCKNAQLKNKFAPQTITTGRTLQEYVDLVGRVPMRDDLTYIEFGCGLSSFVPEYAKVTRDPKKIIAIDRFDYSCADALLKTALCEDYEQPPIKNKIRELQENSEVITDPSQVTLLNMNLSEAVRTRSDLANSADLGIDVAGVFGYLFLEIPNEDFLQTHAGNLQASLHDKVMQDARFFLKPSAELRYTNKLRGRIN